MRPVRELSARPQVQSDAWGFRLYDPVTRTIIGRQGPLGRERVVAAVKMGDGPRRLEPDRCIVDCWGFYLADPGGNVVGKRGIVVDRILSASWSHDTRRL